MARASRSAAAAAKAKAPTPPPEASDGEMDEAPTQYDGNDEQDDADGVAGEEDENPGTPVNDSESASQASTPARGRTSVTRKRRAGRPPKVRNPDRGTPDDPPNGGSEKGTPRKRGGWRGGPRGSGFGRWGKPRGGPSHVNQTRENVENDEVILPEDAQGETKVDKNGQLQGDREYRVRVFTIEGKDDRLYMLSTEPARCIGFRDSYLFFQKHPNLHKIILAEEAKRDLIERSIIPHSYKGRAIGVVTARSVFREFGAKIIIGGKKVTDDYQAAMARANGDVEGEMAVPEDQLPSGGMEYDKNRYVAWHGASSVYHSAAPSLPMQPGKGPDGKKRKIVVTGDNWMYEHALAASRYNHMLTEDRRESLNGVYDIHTNTMQYPQTMQPTHARWERILTPPPVPTKVSTSQPDAMANAGANGTPSSLTVDGKAEKAKPTMFPPVDPVVSRNYMVADTYFVGPPKPDMPYPGPDGDEYDIGPKGILDIKDDIIEFLPDECKKALLEAREVERQWKAQWGTEQADGLRAHVPISYNS